MALVEVHRFLMATALVAARIVAPGEVLAPAGTPETGTASSAAASAPTGLVGGRLFPADGGSLAGIRVAVRDDRGSYDALIDSTGLFVAALPGEPVGTIELVVSSDPADRRYHDSVVRLRGSARNAGVRVALIPTVWTIEGGAYAGRVAAIDPARAIARTGDGAGFWRVTRRSLPAAIPVGWVADSFPVPVAFRRARGDVPISPMDSTRFWALATEVEQLLGRRLFRPVPAALIDAGAPGILVAVQPAMSAAGRTFTTHDGAGRIFEALVTVRSRELLGDSRVAMHELLHALGFGHTGSWRSVMGTRVSTSPLVPTEEDVAHAQLIFRVATLQREHEIAYGIDEAVAAMPGRALADRSAAQSRRGR